MASEQVQMDTQVVDGNSSTAAREEVLSTPELLERILEYVASGEPWEEARNLRLVCKSWRDNSIQGLCLSRDLPKAEVSLLDRIREVYPLGSGLPIHVHLAGKMSAEIIAEINLSKQMLEIPEVPENLVFNMVNLRRITMWQSGGMTALLRKILEKAERVTHTNITCYVSNLGNLLPRNQLSRLIKLDVTVRAERESNYIDFAHFNSLLEPFYPNLESLSLRISVFERLANDHPTFLLPPLPKVKNLIVKLPIGIQEEFRLSDAPPNLSDLRLCIGESGVLNVLDGALVYKNLKHLYLDCKLYSPMPIYDERAVNLPLEQELIAQCPALESFTCSGVSDQFMLELMPMVFAQIKTIKTLNISMDCGDRGTPDKVTRLLTGLHQDEIPSDKGLWGSILKRKTNVITNLNRLESFTITVKQRNVNCFMGTFLFKSAFFRMPNLKKLEVLGNVEVYDGMVKAWKADGRNIKWIEPTGARTVPFGNPHKRMI